MPYERRRTLVLNGGPIRLHESGRSDAPVVLLLHGAGGDTAEFIWYHLPGALAPERRVVGVDFPRHGGSRPWPQSLQIDHDALVRIVHAVLTDLDVERADLVGLSMGGAVAISYALAHPQRVGRRPRLGPPRAGSRGRRHRAGRPSGRA